MAKVQPDYSFHREGLTLREWLLKLVGDKRAEREAAGKVLMGMAIPPIDVGLPGVDRSADLAEHNAAFQKAIRVAVAAADFDTAEFIRRLCAYRVMLADDWRRRVDDSVERQKPGEKQWERISEKLVAKINSSSDPAVRREASTRLTRALCAISAREERIDKRVRAGAEGLSPASTAARVIFNVLDAAFLAAPEAMQLVLDHAQESHEALAALERIGPPAIAFAPQLLRRIQRNSSAEAAGRALGSIVRDNGAFIDQIRKRLHDSREGSRNGAAAALTCLETQVAGREQEIVSDLLALLAKKVEFQPVQALASVGRHIPGARERVIELARPRPPVWKSVPWWPDMKLDLVMYERGYAVDAMRYLSEYAEECVPVLIEAIDSFEEYDPDESYHGPASRVARALKCFGPAAGAAALLLAQKLSMEDGILPKAILEALAAMGPAARGALGRLEQFRKQLEEDDPLPDLAGPRPNQSLDPVGWTIWAIER